MAKSEKPEDAPRDERGRFTKGNPGGPGGARRKSCELRRAIEDAISSEHVQAIMRRAARMALEGDLKAMQFVVDRACGKAAATQADPEPLEVQLPALDSAADCKQAVQTILDGVCNGTLPQDAAKLLVTAVQARLRAIEVDEIEERLRRVEESADLHQGRRR